MHIHTTAHVQCEYKATNSPTAYAVPVNCASAVLVAIITTSLSLMYRTCRA